MLEDERGRRVIFLSHCILNSNAKAMGLVTQEFLERSSKFIKALLKHRIEIVQMPCPELFFGLIRAPATKVEYDIPSFREHCDSIASEIAKEVNTLISAGVRVLAIVGVEGSPSCGVRWTHRAPREQASKGYGIFVESLEKKILELGIDVKLTGFPGKGSYGDLEELMREFL